MPTAAAPTANNLPDPAGDAFQSAPGRSQGKQRDTGANSGSNDTPGQTGCLLQCVREARDETER
jgi:hypothetical protein